MHEDFELESLSGRKTTLSSNLSLGFYDILTKKTQNNELSIAYLNLKTFFLFV